jgi:hypothetical protein
MAKKRIYFVLNLIAVAAMAIPAAQAIGDDKGPIPGTGSSAGTPPLTWEEFKEACRNPKQFQQQVPPWDIRIQCTEIRREWVPNPLPPGPTTTTSTRKIISSIFSSKFHVTAEEKTESAPSKGGAAGGCIRFKEVEKTYTIERKLTCDDILTIKGTLPEYCSVILAKGSGTLISVRDTGRVIDTCGDTPPPVPPGPSPGSEGDGGSSGKGGGKYY